MAMADENNARFSGEAREKQVCAWCVHSVAEYNMLEMVVNRNFEILGKQFGWELREK